jgi:hypothetical protein
MFLDMSVSWRQYVLGYICKGGGSMFLDMSVSWRQYVLGYVCKLEAVCSWTCL